MVRPTPTSSGATRRFFLGLSFALTPLLLIAVIAGTAGAGTGPSVFINEFHYDNTSTDEREFIEIAGPAGTDLSGYSTCWLRVAQAWAGATAPAFLFIPRVGMEVLVTFIDGDPDRLLVTGCVYNGDNSTLVLLSL